MKNYKSKVESDFKNQQKDFIFAHFAGDNKGLLYSFIDNEDERYTTAGFQHARNDPQAKENSGWHGGFISSGYVPSLLTLQIPEVVDLTSALNYMKKKNYDYNSAIASKGLSKNRQTSLPGYIETIEELSYLKTDKNQSSLSLDLTQCEGDFKSLNSQYKAKCNQIGWNPSLLENLNKGLKTEYPTNPDYQIPLIAMLFNTVRICSQTRNMNIHLPSNFPINSADERLFIGLLLDNVYITSSCYARSILSGHIF